MSIPCTAAANQDRDVRIHGQSAPLAPFSGFTLFELLAAIGLIAVMTAFLIGSLAGGGRAIALQSAQATVANLITAARTKAPATNRKCRLLLNTDPDQPGRYLCLVALQVARQPGSSPADWDTVLTAKLPPETYVVPSALAGLVSNPAEWKRVADPTADLVSDLFANQTLTCALEGDSAAQIWTGVAFTPNHTLAALSAGPPPKGTIVLAAGRQRAPGTYSSGQPPVELLNPQGVRGLALGAYGVPVRLDERSAF